MEITESPCIQVCVMDRAAGLCIGCGRTIDEISRWAAMSPAERRAIMDRLPRRLAEAKLEPLPPRVRTGRRRLRERS
ncbi:DUF1289 domain-containing protein [Alsobacter sp. SYSU M60028]|uniref:DUF1289 domain-containing protein n=1 Tax=Alsobacter ponti TaxID=2962936 RepID=A0ABT1LGT1_9HYPH|nr:DUF1289 domain-containing protein [Alsobacter ponti]MCP8940654.1 DUF1289 domain-containing protein [Alsobacter ponti]